VALTDIAIMDGKHMDGPLSNSRKKLRSKSLFLKSEEVISNRTLIQEFMIHLPLNKNYRLTC
jgi:hypothetical protein